MYSTNNNQRLPELQLNIRPSPDVNLKFPPISKPKPLGYFSVVGRQSRKYELSASQLRYYKKPKKFPLDLNTGLQLAIKKPESSYEEKLDHILKFIVDKHEKLFMPPDAGMPLVGAEFVCWRGLLRLIMCTPYENRQDWTIHVIRYKGTFYLSKHDTEFDKQQRAQENDMQKRMAAYGFKFEQYCLTDLPFSEPNTNEPVDECSEFSCVFRTTLNGLTMLYGAEMDGIISEEPVPLDNLNLESLKFVELKVRQNNLNSRQIQSYKRYKTRNWWCQSFLVGIEDLFVGLRDENGIINKIDHLEIRQLPKESNLWSPAVCFNFLEQFLGELRKLMANVNCPYTTYELHFNSNSSRITYKCLSGANIHSFLPNWYIELLRRSV